MRSTLLVLVLLSACGGGGGSDGDSPAPTDTPTATAAVASTSTPTALPTPAATTTAAPAFAEVLLGVGVVNGAPLPSGGRAATPLLLRNDGNGWESSTVSVPRDGFVNGVTFSSPERAWLYGGRNESFDPVLFRSDDAGRSWVDVSGRLPSDCQAIADIAFADDQLGYLVSRGPFTTAFFVTRDGGGSWRTIEPPAPFVSVAALAAGVRHGSDAVAVEVVRYGGGLAIVPLDGSSTAALGAPPDSRIAGANAFATAGSQGWIAATVPTRSNDSVHTRATIFRSADLGAAWVEQPVAATTAFPELRGIDVRDAVNGVAGGAALTAREDATVPYALVIAPDGASWQEAPIAGLAEGWVVIDALRTRGDGGWAIATFSGVAGAESALLRSDDGGRSWHVDGTPIEGDVQLFDLARNTAVAP